MTSTFLLDRKPLSGFQTTTQDLSVFPFLPRHYHLTRVLLSPFITTVWTPVVLAIINIIKATLKIFMMMMMLKRRGKGEGKGVNVRRSSFQLPYVRMIRDAPAGVRESLSRERRRMNFRTHAEKANWRVMYPNGGFTPVLSVSQWWLAGVP